MQSKTYVLDTNIIVDYVDIIPDEAVKQPVDPTIDLSEAEIIIPTAVIRELSGLEKENNERGRAARTALRRIRKIFEGYGYWDEQYFYELNAPAKTEFSKQTFYILPVDKRSKTKNRFQPAEDDMDGQIILTAMVAEKYEIPGNEVILLTNDNGLAIRAIARGIRTSCYGQKYPEPYTGRHD